jgi:uncharacterized protein YndB with AHSA1/START domain
MRAEFQTKGAADAAAWIAHRPLRSAARTAAIRVARNFAMPPQHAFDAWVDPEIARQWLFATATRPIAQVDIDARVGGSFRFVDRRDDELLVHAGRYIEIVRPTRLAFTIDPDDRVRVATRVVVDIRGSPSGCSLVLIHAGVPGHCARDTRARWIGILYGLAQTPIVGGKP